MAKTKTKPDKKLYTRLRDSGVRKEDRWARRGRPAGERLEEPQEGGEHCRRPEQGGRFDPRSRGRRIAQAIQGGKEGCSDSQGKGREAEQGSQEGGEGPLEVTEAGSAACASGRRSVCPPGP